MKATRGFTLIEMLTVVVIVGIILAIGIPLMNNMSRATALQGAVREVSNTLQLARQFAITHRTRTEVVFTNATAFCVFTNNHPVATDNWPVDKWRNLPTGAVIDLAKSQPTPCRISFKPTGDATDQGTIVVREGTLQGSSLVATNKNLATITVTPVLGRIQISTP